MNDQAKKHLMEACRRQAVEWTRDLVRINSENPPGRELEAAEFCAAALRETGMDVTLDEFAPGRANVTAFFGNPAELGLVFNGHIDVVAANSGWNDPPFAANIHDGKIWGRGSADMKSGCAAMMAAAKYIIESGAAPQKGFALTFVADEERVNQGAIRLRQTCRLQADACVVCEPTRLQVHYGNRGYTSFFIRTHGKACHACDTGKGVNAIYKMARVLEKLEAFEQTLRGRVNPQLGSVSLNVGTIRGGKCLNTVPDFCEIEVESRVFPGMDARSMCAELRALLGDEAEVVVRSNLLGSLVPVESRIVRRAAAAVTEVTGQEAVITNFPACSEASFFSVGYQIPTILLGPGSIGVAHKANEFVEIREVEDAVSIYARLIEEYTGLS